MFTDFTNAFAQEAYTMSSDQKYIIDLIEDIAILYCDIVRARELQDYTRAIVVFSKLRIKGSLSIFVLEKWEACSRDYSLTLQDGNPFEELRLKLENFAETRHLPIFK